MAKEAYLCLLFLFSFLITSCSVEISSGFSYHGKGDTSTSARTISFLQQSNVSPTHIRIFIIDHRILSTLSNSKVVIDLYLNKTHLLNILSHSNIKSIIASCGNECLAQNEMPLFLHAFKSIGSVLKKIHLGKEVKISLKALHENSIRKILSFIKETKSFAMVEDNISGELSMGDYFVHAIIKRATLAASILPCKDVPIVLTIKSTVILPSMELAQFSEKISKYLEFETHIRKIIAAFYIEVHSTKDFASKKLKRSLDNTTNPTNIVFPTNPASSAPIIAPPDTPTTITIPATNAYWFLRPCSLCMLPRPVFFMPPINLLQHVFL
ncbi:hypothetical protein JHK87_055358 [Glycine soja]|nr:hypothetical protein JHK87_055358 [Glycine soja]